MYGCVKTFKRAISIASIVLGIAASADAATITLAWDPNPEPDVAGYRVSFGTNSGQYTTTVDVGNITIYTLTNLLPGNTYYFALQAYNPAGTSPYSNEVSVTLLSPLTVTNLTANRASPQPPGTTITFSATASGGTPPYQYKWWIITGSTQTVGSNWSTNSTFAWTPTVANANYTIRVWARNALSIADAPDSSAATLQMSYAIAASGGPTNQAPTVNAGADQSITLPSSATLSATVSDDGLPSGSLTRSWTRVSGPGTVTFSAPTSATTSASFSAAGAYVLRLTASDGVLSTSDDVAVTVAVAPTGTPTGGPIAYWRLDETTGATAADTAGSYAGTLTNGAAWTTGKSGGAVRLDGVDDYIALPNVDVPGSAITMAAWLNSSSFPATSDQRFVSKATTVAEQDHYWMLGQTLAAGPSRLRFRLKTNGATTTLVASSGDLPLNTWYHAAATYDGTQMRLYLNGVLVGSVAKSGALTTNAAVPVNIGRNPDARNYMHGVVDDVRIYNRALTPSEITAMVNGAASPNQPPVVNAGANQTVTLPASATVNGSVSDDGQPMPAALTMNWTRASGPGTVTFSNPNASSTTASFSAAGTYVLLLTASDGALSAADDMTVTVAAAPVANVAPTVNAGADRTITLPSGTALSATVSDDGKPNPPGVLTLAWTRVSGPGTVTFSAPSAATTNANFSVAGTYVLRLTVSDGALSTIDDVTVIVNGASTPPSGLVAHYRLDETAGTVASDAAGSNSGTLVNGAAWAPGRHGGGVSFDGSNDYIALPSITASGAGFTVAMWVFTDNFQRSDQQFLSKANGTSEQASDWMLGFNSRRLRFRLKTNGVTTTLTAPSGQLPRRTWYHATATYDGARMRLYMNGVEVNSVAKSGAVAMNANVPLNLGRNPAGSNHVDGMLDDVRIYNRALTPAEIGALMSNP
jgi:Concanavalin A-like lectin/glucanases superfamily/Fibronectin type III domain